MLIDTWFVPYCPGVQAYLDRPRDSGQRDPGERVVADAGLKAISAENGLLPIEGIPGLRVKALHIEHTLLEPQDASVSVGIRDKVELWVHRLEPTLNLHRHIYGIKSGEVEALFQIAR